MLSFPAGEAAVLAALELQETAPDPLRLRAGVHSGEAVVTARRPDRPRRQRRRRVTESREGRPGAGHGRRPRRGGRAARSDVRAGPPGAAEGGVRGGVGVSGDLPLTGLAPDDAGAFGLPRPRDLGELLDVQRHACRSIGSCSTSASSATAWPTGRCGGAHPRAARPHEHDPFGSALAAALPRRGAPHRARGPGAGRWPPTTRRPAARPARTSSTSSRPRSPSTPTSWRGGSTTVCRRTRSAGRRRWSGALLEVARLGPPAPAARGRLQRRAQPPLGPLRVRGRRPAPSATRTARCGSTGPWTGRRARPARTASRSPSGAAATAPVDATTDEGRLTLRSFVWPDQLERFRRLDGAIEVARRVPATVDQADGAGVAGRAAGTSPPPAAATVVVHSIVLQYLTAERPPRAARLRSPPRAGGPRADAPLAWLRMEPGGDGAEVRLTVWPGGDERLVAISGYHGPPIRWLGRT